MSAALKEEESARREIMLRFERYVKGHVPLKRGTKGHDGHAGHWLEEKMGIMANGRNEPDLLGFEMKKNSTANKITFGDFSADAYIFKKKTPLFRNISRQEFLQIFGKPNQKKDGRPSWSGEVCPTVRRFNRYGQKLEVDGSGNVIAVYDYSKDARTNKDTIVPKHLREEGRLELARWNRESLRKKFERKFKQRGFFICFQNAAGIFTEIRFGPPLLFEDWINFISSGEVFFDSGMYDGNNRPYSQWRASNCFWQALLE